MCIELQFETKSNSWTCEIEYRWSYKAIKATFTYTYLYFYILIRINSVKNIFIFYYFN